MGDLVGFGREGMVRRLGGAPRGLAGMALALVGLAAGAGALTGCAGDGGKTSTGAEDRGAVPPVAVAPAVPELPVLAVGVTPAVPGLPAPPESVLQAQKDIAVPPGFVRSGAGRIWCEMDGAEMVLVPAGEFVMGQTADDSDVRDDQMPSHRVYLSAYLADRHEVTNGQFARFVEATGYRTDAEKEGKGYALVGDSFSDVAGADWRHPEGPSSSIQGMDTHPVVLVSWNDAKAYGDWAGRRLPTEAEFEKCLRGGVAGAKYPWGDEGAPRGRPGNYADEALRKKHASFTWIIERYDDGYERTSPAGSFEQNGMGLYDITGNAWEWCADWYDESYYGSLGGGAARDPQGPATGSLRVLRGGCWLDHPINLGCALRNRFEPVTRNTFNGFRCARGFP